MEGTQNISTVVIKTHIPFHFFFSELISSLNFHIKSLYLCRGRVAVLSNQMVECNGTIKTTINICCNKICKDSNLHNIYNDLNAQSVQCTRGRSL